MDLKARVDVNCERKDGMMDGRTDENRTPMSHAAKAEKGWNTPDMKFTMYVYDYV